MRKISLATQIILGFVLGTTVGLVLSEFASPETVKGILPWNAPFGDVLVAMLKMVVYPIILFSLVCGAASLSLKDSGRIGGRVLVWYLATSLLATVFGVFMAMLMDPTLPAAGAETMAAGQAEGVKALAANGTGGASFGDFLVGIFKNPFEALASGSFLSIIVFAIAFGLFARVLVDTSKDADVVRCVCLLLDVFSGVEKVSFKLIECVVLYFPYGVFALTASNFARNGTLLFGPYLRITLAVVVGVSAMILVIYPLAIAIFCRQNPIPVMLKMKDTMLTAFITRSSAAALPVSFRTMDGLGVARSLSSFSLPLGATVNMNGVCIHLPVFVVLAANLFGHSLGAVELAMLCLSILFAAIGAGGVPGGSVFLLFMVLENMGLAADQVSLVVALALGINPILDMFETCCNVAGDNVCTYIVAKGSGLVMHGKLDHADVRL